MLEIITMVQGPVQTNTYLVADPITGQAAVIDPAWNGLKIVNEAQSQLWTISQIWLTHAHLRSLAWSPLLLKSCCIKLIWGYTRSMAGHLFSGSLFRTHPRYLPSFHMVRHSNSATFNLRCVIRLVIHRGMWCFTARALRRSSVVM